MCFDPIFHTKSLAISMVFLQILVDFQSTLIHFLSVSIGFQGRTNPAFSKPCLCLSDTRHFRHFRRFRGSEERSPCFQGVEYRFVIRRFRQNGPFWQVTKSAPGKWGRTQMGSDGFNRILTGFYLLDPARVRPVPSETHDFKGFRPDFDQILSGV